MEKKVFEHNVVVAVFKVESEGYQALTELKQAALGESYCVAAAALVKKEDGTCTVLDGFDTGVQTNNDTVKGGLIGMLVGIIGGPIGMLLGAAYGSLIGASMDTADAFYEASMLEQIADKLDDGMVAIVAYVSEETPDALDKQLSRFDTVIARFNAEVVADEVDRACEMQVEMARQAKMQLRKERKKENVAKFEDNVDKVYEKAEEQAGVMADNFNAAADKLADEMDAVKERQEEAHEKMEENKEILRHGFTK